ncbi:MAG TPA: PGF-pre-PGF domain-containing protein [archaeon]|nr:PGF-pre-PGF domain-containing protein [archaeon]
MKKIFILAMFVILVSGIAFADGSVSSVDTSLSASSATTGTSVVLTATSTASSSDVSNVQITLVKATGPGDFSVSDPSGGSYTTTVTTSGTSKTFTFTAGSAGTYTYYVNDVYSGGSKASTTETVEFVAPSSLSVSGSASTATVAQGQSTSLTVNVQNSQASNILTSYSLTYASGNLSISGDPTSSSGTTVSAGTTKSLAWTITHSSCFTGTKTVVFGLGDNTNAHTLTITGNTSCTTTTTTNTTTSSSSGGGGAGSNATTNTTVTKESQSFSSVAATPLTLKFTKISNGVTEIELTTLFNKNSVQMSVADGTKPSAGDPVSTGAVYKYIDITKVNAVDSDFSLIKIRFKVPKTWITTNSIDSLKVSLYRYNNGWDKLVTTRTSSDSTYYYYEAISPGFSTFSIAGEAAASTSGTPSTPTTTSTGTLGTGNTTGTPSTDNQLGTTGTSSVPSGSTDANVMVGAVVLVLAVLFGAVYYFFLKKPKKYNYAPGKK